MGEDRDADRPASTGPRDASFWAKPVGRLRAGTGPTDVPNFVEGKHLMGPIQGFGQMWQKTYRIRFDGTSVSPREVVKTWKEHFPEFWPRGNRFYAPLVGIAPGEVALFSISLLPGPVNPVKLSTGVMVLYADEDSFTFMNPEGHMFAGWITFSAYEEAGITFAQAQVLIRTNDPLYEIAMMLFGFRQEDRFWQQTLRNLAARFGVTAEPDTHAVCVDPRRQWARAGNLWHNAAIRSGLYATAAPLRWLAKPFRKP